MSPELPGGGSHYHFCLYVAGIEDPKSIRAISTLRRLCANYLKDRCTYDIVDVCTQPERAEQVRAIVTPLLIKTAPLPAQRIVGDLSNLHQVMLLLNLV